MPDLGTPARAWTSFETWAIYEWLIRRPRAHQRAVEAARYSLDLVRRGGTLSKAETAVRREAASAAAADRLRTMIEQENPEAAKMGCYKSVDWLQIASLLVGAIGSEGR